MSETTVNASFPANVQPTVLKYRFKKDDVGNQRPAVEINAQVLSLNGVKEILELDTTPKDDSEEEKARVAFNKNQQELLLEAATQYVYRSVIGDWVAADDSNTAEKFDQSKFTWAVIANMPKEDRRSSSIPKEVWEAFAKDYAQVMATVGNRTPEQLQAAISVYQKKFSIIKTNKPAITFLKNQLALYIEHTKQGDNFIEVIELLVRKAKDLLEDKVAEDLVGNLGM